MKSGGATEAADQGQGRRMPSAGKLMAGAGDQKWSLLLQNRAMAQAGGVPAVHLRLQVAKPAISGAGLGGGASHQRASRQGAGWRVCRALQARPAVGEPRREVWGMPLVCWLLQAAGLAVSEPGAGEGACWCCAVDCRRRGQPSASHERGGAGWRCAGACRRPGQPSLSHEGGDMLGAWQRGRGRMCLRKAP